MKKINQWMIGLYVLVSGAWEEFKSSERGDTNFVSMLLIIGIVVVLAGAFLILGKNVMATVQKKVTDFLNSLG